MNDPMAAMHQPSPSVDPDPAFAARLRTRLEQLLLGQTEGDATMSDTQTHDVSHAEAAWPPSITPYIAVADARAAVDWYIAVFDGHRRGEMYVMPDGSVGHAEIGIGDAALMLSEGSSEVPVAPPSGGPFSHTLHLQVPDVDVTVRRAAEAGAAVERQPTDEPYGRVAVLVDPFGHRWMLNQPPGRATRLRQGDVAYITLSMPDDEQAKAFYGAVLGWRYTPGRVERGWNVVDVRPPIGIGGGAREHSAQVCYRVVDIDAAIARVWDHGGRAGSADRHPYGLLAECTDNQGVTFQLWQPVD